MERYRVESKLGEGGMGIVYRARQVDPDRQVALKFLLGETDLTEVNIARFKREMDVLMALSHPNVVRVYDAGELDGKLYYAMEMLDARDLADVVRHTGPLPFEPLASVLAQVLEALTYIHERKLVHRDIKPANIMLERSGRAVLMDFGLVRKVDGTMLTQQGKLLGTPRYFPPEYIRGGEGTPACDIWSLGVTAYECLTGERPFDAETLQALAISICKDQPKAIREHRPETPAPLARVVQRMLEKDPAHRYASATEALQALREATAPRVVEQSAELSRELLIGLPELAEAAAPAEDPTAKVERPHSRPTGRRPRITGTVPRTTGKVPAAAPPRAPRSAIVAGVVVALVLIAVSALGRRAHQALPPPAVAAAPDHLSANYDAPDRLVVCFTTSDASRWSVDCGGVSVGSDEVSTATHRIAVQADPMLAPKRILLLAPGRSLEVDPPPSPAERVRSLERALAALKADAHRTDDIFERMRKRMRHWIMVTEFTVGDEPHHIKPGEGATPEVAQKDIAAQPDIAQQFDDYVRGLRENKAIAQDLEAVLAMSPALLADEHLPLKLRDELLGTLLRLDLVDMLAEYIGRPPPFRVLDRLRPVLEVSSEDLGFDSPPREPKLTAEQELIWTHARGSWGSTIHLPEENFLKVQALGDTSAVMLEPSLNGWRAADYVDLRSSAEPGPGGRRITLWLYGFGAQLYAALRPEGYTNTLPLRLRGVQYGLTHTVRMRVTLRGPLARPASWRLLLKRCFASGPRLYYGVITAAAEPLPR